MSLGTPRLTLDPLADTHVEALLDLFREPHVRRYLLDDAVVDRAWVDGEVEASQARFASGSVGLYAAHHRNEPDRLVGFAGFRPFYEPPVLQLVYAVAPEHTGRGIAREMARAVIDLAFSRYRFEEVRASTDAPNLASVRVLERLGMTLIATEPGQRWAQLHFALRAPA
jgi:ribosomal-protein-alanine N-acetyltransferase